VKKEQDPGVEVLSTETPGVGASHQRHSALQVCPRRLQIAPSPSAMDMVI
jgi:hypothetical protein